MKMTSDQMKALDLNRNLMLTAGAGSGKTTVLVNRYLHILLHNPHLEPKNILAITYTEKAAAEMKEKIFRDIDRRFNDDSNSRERLFNILKQLNDAQIFTIHAFCSSLLRQYPLESGIAPDFTVLNEVLFEDLFHKSFRNFFFGYSVGNSIADRLKISALRELSVSRLNLILKIVYGARAILRPILSNKKKMNPDDIRHFWTAIFLEYHQNVLKPLLRTKAFFAQVGELSAIELPEKTAEKARTINTGLQEQLGVLGKTTSGSVEQINAIIKILQLLTKQTNTAFIKIPGGKKAWGEEGVSLFSGLSQVAAKYVSGVIPLDVKTEKIYSEIFSGFVQLVLEFLDYFEKEKNKLNAVDFEDLQLKTIQLLKNNPEARKRIRQHYPFILVDEFQDTDVLQAEILELLTYNLQGKLDKNRLFVVGDPQQSIFGFRYADVSIFHKFSEKIRLQGSEKTAIKVAGSDQNLKATDSDRRGIISLSRNFRSTPALIHFFNTIFSQIFRQESPYDVNFQKLDPWHELEKKSRIQLDLFFEESQEKADMSQVQAEEIAGKIKSLMKSGPKNNRNAPAVQNSELTFGDMAILIRSRNHLEVIERTLRVNDIPYQTFKGRGFFRSQEVQDIYYILQSLVNPLDDFALLTFLRSPYVGLSDACLFYLKQVQGKNFWERLQKFDAYLTRLSAPEEVFSPEFFRFLNSSGFHLYLEPEEQAALHHLVIHFPEWSELAIRGYFTLLLDELIENLQIRAVLAAQDDSEQKLANLDKFIHYIFSFEQGNSVLLVDLLDHIKKQISGQVAEGEATILSEDQNKVNIITYHSAKGMEFPVVFLPFLEANFRFNGKVFVDKNYGVAFNLEHSREKAGVAPFAFRFLQAENKKKISAEEKRLLYVAMTRAKVHLFLSGSLNKNLQISENCSLKILLNSMNVAVEELANRENFRIRKDNFEVKLVSHPGDTAKKGHGESKDLKKEIGEPGLQLDPKMLRYLQFVEESSGGQVYSATQLMLFQEDEHRYFRHFYLNDGNIFPPQADPEFYDEPGGALWGSLVHNMLENYHLRSLKFDLQKINQLLLSSGLTGENETKDIREKLLNQMKQFRDSPVGRMLAESETYSEFAVEMPIGPFHLRGIFDVLFRNRSKNWEIVDFKSNRMKAGEVHSTAQKYHFQMEAYALLLSGLKPGQNIFPVTLCFLEPMQTFRKVYRSEEILEIKEKVLYLMQRIFNEESTLFYE